MAHRAVLTKEIFTRGVFRGGPNRRAPPLNAAIIVVSTRVLRSSKSTKINSGRGFAPDPTGGAHSAHSAPVDRLLVGGASYLFPRTPLRLGPSGLAPPILTDRRLRGQVR